MDLLAEYSDGERGSPGSPDGSGGGVEALRSKVVSAAPAVDTAGLALVDNRAVSAASTRMLLPANAREVQYNLPYQDMAAPVMGPKHPFQKDGLAAGMKNHRAGHVESTHLHSFAFDEQYNTFHSYGFAAAPTGQGTVQHGAEADGAGGETVYGNVAKRRKTTTEKKEAAARKAALAAEAAGAPPDAAYEILVKQPWAEKEVKAVELTEEQKEYMAKFNAEKEEKAAAKGEGGEGEGKGATSFFHGKEAKDYQGRSWLAVPKDRKKDAPDAFFLPKKWLHTWSGHTKGVNAIRLFPTSGHLLLSAGLDGKVKIWDVFGSGKCMRTYLGHTKGVRDVNFTTDGSRFISVGYDRVMRLWDTETGQVVRTLNNGKQHYCGVFHPEADKQNVLMTGCQDKKIYQWDLETGDVMQEYNYHLGAVNAVTFFDDGRRFVSSSDDKSLRVWEFGIPVQIKYIADPSMHSMPSLTLAPNKQSVLAQSLDNQVVTYTCSKDRFKQNRKKTFKGHNTAGYACQVNFSPDAKYVLSGDSEGRAFFWEWARPQKIVRTIKAHEGVCIGAVWHPLESSKVITCGWDGLIKMWD
ncbi:MAG: WD40-repeat-containing domain protein [Monoraphidium minutum]|nr:MAG: WD40-repeat-containing domain protein [Monoraphidium minutum]